MLKSRLFSVSYGLELDMILLCVILALIEYETCYCGE